MKEMDARKIRNQAFRDYRLGKITREEMQRIVASTREVPA